MVSSNSGAAARKTIWALLAAAALYFCLHAAALLILPLVAATVAVDPRPLAATAIVLYSVSAAVLDVPAARLLRRLPLRRLAGTAALFSTAALASTIWVRDAPGLLIASTVLGAATAGLMGPILSSLATAAGDEQQRVQCLNAAGQRVGALVMGVAAVYVLADPEKLPIAVMVGVGAGAGLLAAGVAAKVPRPNAQLGQVSSDFHFKRADIARGMLLNALIPLLMIFGASFLPLAALTDASFPIAPGTVAAGLVGRELVAIVTSLISLRWHRISPHLLVISTTLIGAISLGLTAVVQNSAVFVILFSLQGAVIAAAIIASNVHLAFGSTAASRPTAFALGGIASRVSAVLSPVLLGTASISAAGLILTTSGILAAGMVTYAWLGLRSPAQGQA